MANIDGLRHYQLEIGKYVRALPNGSSAVIQSPTGSGKTLSMADTLLDSIPQLMLTHRRVLYDMMVDVFKSHGIDFGHRARGYKPNLKAPVQLAMWQTEWARTFRTKQWPMHDCARVQIDEPHALKGPTIYAMLNAYNLYGATLVGWTATPANLGHIFKQKFVAATVKQLIAEGFLVPVVNYGPTVPDMERLERVKRDVNGDFGADALDEVYNQKVVFGKIIENLRLINPELRPTVLFAPGVPHSIWAAQTLTAAGIPAAHIDGKSIWYNGKEMDSTSQNREKIFKLLRQGVIKVICNRFVLREGWNEPCISHAILCPFGSMQSYFQAVGRILRLFEGKKQATVQDHGGNTLRFPDIDSEVDWDLNKKDKEISAGFQRQVSEGQIPEPIACPKCNAMRTKGNVCPLCHYRNESETRTIVQVEGILQKRTGKLAKEKLLPGAGRSDADVWKGLYWGNIRNYPNRTFRQIYTNHARRYNFEGRGWLAKNLPFMPRNPDDWSKRVRDVAVQDLF